MTQLPPQAPAAAPAPLKDKESAPVADAVAGNWVDVSAPLRWRPYLRLARLDRPIGTWLLLFPCWWSLTLASLSTGRPLPHPYPNLWYLVLFAVGAAAMRGAGCTWNDIVDRNYDARVQRTANRPIPSGQVSVAGAVGFAILLSLVGLFVLLSFNPATIVLGASSLLLVAVYPFMKRYTYWPQAVLGLAFNWGALVGWTAVKGTLDWPPLLLYAGAVLWTLGYDTIYAHQDRSDDLMAGLKSTALKFGAHTRSWVGGFYTGAAILWGIAGFLAGAHLIFFLAVALAALQLSWQVATLHIDDPANCLRRFKSNRDVGLVIFLGLLTDLALSWLAGLM